MTGTNGTSGKGVAGHFGRQMRRDRLAHGWSIAELAAMVGINPAHLSRVENGRRPPTARIADGLDKALPERRGWYLQWFDDIRTAPEVPATFRNWSDYEDKSVTLRAWTPGIIDGLAQTEDYIKALIATAAGSSAEAATARFKARTARQQRVLGRAKPPLFTLLTDEAALYRQVGTPGVMADQMSRLLELAALPNVILQIVPEVGHDSVASAYIIADDAVWSESVIQGGAFTDEQTLTAMIMRFDTLRGEAYRVSESLKLIERQREAWTSGSLPIRRAAGASA